MVTESSVGGAALAGLEIKSLVTPPTKVISSQDPIAAAKIQERWTEEERDFVCWFRRKAVPYNNISAFLHHHFKVRRDGADIAKEYNDLASNSENIAERIRSAQTKGWSKTGYFKDLLPVANKLSTTLKRIKRNEKQDRKLSKRQANEDTKRKRQRLGNGSNKTATQLPSKGNDLLRAAQAESASPYRTSHKPQEQKSIEIICHQPVAGRIDFFTRSGSDAELHRWDEGSLQRKYPKELERYKTPNPSTIVTGNDKEPGFSVLGSIDEYLERSRRSNDELAPVLRDRMSQTLEQRTKKQCLGSRSQTKSAKGAAGDQESDLPENDPTVAGDARSENQQTAPFGRPLHRSPTAPELVARLHPKDRFLASVWFHYSIAGNLRGAGRRVQSIISINHEHIITPDCYHLILFEGDSKPALVHIDELDLCLPPLL